METKKEEKLVELLIPQLRAVVVKLAEQSGTSLAPILMKYTNHMKLSLKDQGDSEFPRSMKAHRFNRGRSLHRSVGDLLCFHIGNAILALYADNLEEMESEVRRLERLAESGMSRIGDDRAGYELTAPAKPKKVPDVVPTPAKS